jgi:hypothetical protein
MSGHSKDREPLKARRLKTVTRKPSNAPKAGRRRSLASTHETELARVVRERDEALEQQAAIRDILRVISNSPGDVQPVLSVELQFRRHVLDRRRSAATADIIGKALGIERIVRQKVEPLALHRATVTAVDTPHLQFQKNPRVAARQIAHPPLLAIVPAHLLATAAPASRFFERRLSLITRAFGSPKIPHTVCAGRKPAKQYESQSRRVRFAVLVIHPGCQIEAHAETQNR